MSDREFVVIVDDKGTVGIGQILSDRTVRGVQTVNVIEPHLAADMLARFLFRAEHAEAEVERLTTKRGRRA